MSAYGVLYAFLIVSVVFPTVVLVVAKLLRPCVPYDRKESVYECGMPAVGTTEVNLNIRFYVFALLFVIFDVETLFVYPWAVVAKDLGVTAMVEMGVFLTILMAGLGYAWLKGALTWE